ncbi:MAG: helix-turn-helix transcriptional regulator [Acidovorax sp.]
MLTIEPVAPGGVGDYKRSKSGKLPRAVERAKAEAENTALRSEMQDARNEFVNEFMSDERLSLSKLRLTRGYSQQQLAHLIGTSQPHIANIEAGKIDPQFQTVTRLADALGVTLDEIRPLIETAKRN